MKKQLLALSMVATSGLMAQSDGNMSNQSYKQNSTCNVCCSNPCCCCCTNPRPCVDCECYVPQFYNLQCDWGFSIDAEFLYWYARETNLSYASKVEMVDWNPTAVDPMIAFGSASYKHLDAAWDPGFRVGIGYNSCCDGWDYNLTWTWMCNSRKNSTSVSDYGLDGQIDDYPFLGEVGQFLLINPWINASAHGLSEFFGGDVSTGPYLVSFDRVGARYRLRYNQIDLDVGRKYWLSKCFNLRPYAGLRGYWTRVKFRTNSNRTTTVNGTNVSLNLRDKFKTKAWGVGFIAGFEPTWYYSECFAVYAKAGTAALWGDFEVDKTEKYSGVFTSDPSVFYAYTHKDESKGSQMTGMLDLGLGIRWEATWCCDRYRTTVDAGWEHHLVLDQNHRNKTTCFFNVPAGVTGEPTISGNRQYVEATGNLGLGGFVLRVNWDF